MKVEISILQFAYRFSYWRQMQLKLGFCLPEKTTDFSHHWPEMLLENCFASFITLPLPAKPSEFMRHNLALWAKLFHKKPKSSFPHADKIISQVYYCIQNLIPGTSEVENWRESTYSTLEEALKNT